MGILCFWFGYTICLMNLEKWKISKVFYPSITHFFCLLFVPHFLFLHYSTPWLDVNHLKPWRYLVSWESQWVTLIIGDNLCFLSNSRNISCLIIMFNEYPPTYHAKLINQKMRYTYTRLYYGKKFHVLCFPPKKLSFQWY
jgi:hypothetical protein